MSRKKSDTPPQRDIFEGVELVAENYQRVEVIAQLFMVSVRRIQQLTQEGILETHQVPGESGRRYDLIPTIQAYVKYLSDKAYGRGKTETENELKDKKLQAEIALKESQGELHRLRTDIARGKYIGVEEAQIDYQRFFVTFKKFALAIPSRVTGLLSGYVEPVTARQIEKNLTGEVEAMLNTFVGAAQEAPPLPRGGVPDA